MDWMIYPAAKAFIRVCALLFGASVPATVLIHLFMPLFLTCPHIAAPFLLLGTWSELIAILSLSFLAFWSARVLLASQGSRITRTLTALTFLPALYALLIPFAGMPVPSQYAEMDRTWESFLLLAAVTAFFAFPYTRGYPAPARKLFLAWGLLAACNALQGVLFFLFLLLWNMLSGLSAPLTAVLPDAFPLLSCGLDAALAVLSAILAWTLYRNVSGIASLPELQDPEMPGHRE